MIPLALIIGGTGLVPLLVNLVIIILILWLIFTYIVPLLPEPMRVVAQVLLVVLLIVWLASLIVGCTPIQTPVPPIIGPPIVEPPYVPKPKPSPPIPATVGDLKNLATQAADAYIAQKNGKADFAWSIAAGMRAYQTIVKTSADVKKVVSDFSEGKKAGKTFADQLAQLFASTPAPAAKKAEVIATAIEKAASQ